MQNGSDIYKRYNFGSVTAERVGGVEPGTDSTGGGSGGLPAGAIAGIAVGLFLATLAVILTATYIL